MPSRTRCETRPSFDVDEDIQPLTLVALAKSNAARRRIMPFRGRTNTARLEWPPAKQQNIRSASAPRPVECSVLYGGKLAEVEPERSSGDWQKLKGIRLAGQAIHQPGRWHYLWNISKNSQRGRVRLFGMRARPHVAVVPWEHAWTTECSLKVREFPFRELIIQFDSSPTRRHGHLEPRARRRPGH